MNFLFTSPPFYFIIFKKLANISKTKFTILSKLKHLKQKVLPISKTCLVVLSGLEAFCRHLRSVPHNWNVSQGKKKRGISTDTSKVFALSSSWLLRASFPTNGVVQQWRLRHPLAAEDCLKGHVVSSDWSVYWRAPPPVALCGRISLYLKTRKESQLSAE